MKRSVLGLGSVLFVLALGLWPSFGPAQASEETKTEKVLLEVDGLV